MIDNYEEEEGTENGKLPKSVSGFLVNFGKGMSDRSKRPMEDIDPEGDWNSQSPLGPLMQQILGPLLGKKNES